MQVSTSLLISILVSLATICPVSARIVKRAVNWNGNHWAFRCDFRGRDLGNAQVRGEDCGGRCAQTQGCTHFTWTGWNGGTCWMKYGTVSKNDAYETGDPNMVCGVISGSGTSGGAAAGRTTRYWDCCKPSCSWRGKVAGKDTYVQSCRRDGYSVFNHPDATSGCNGGEAFTCNNQQPWAINDQLAYGFAAAHIPGLSEQDRCCACYKLDFTSAPLQGKSMIVQVTNSGDDVGANQFDLQIPGGGVGLFNGCAPQWGAPGDGWGSKIWWCGFTPRLLCTSFTNS